MRRTLAMKACRFRGPSFVVQVEPRRKTIEEAEMTSQHTQSQNGKAILMVVIGGLVFATLFCKLDGATAPSCELLGKTIWAALEVLRVAVTFVRWHFVGAYLYENSRLAQHLLQIGASIWPWLSILAG
jgi:hypothetical protein